MEHNAAGDTTSGAAGEYLLVTWRGLAAASEVLVQQPCESAICELPHWSLMWRQQSCSAAVICWPGRAQANRGADPTSRTTNKQTDLRIHNTLVV